MNVVWAYPEQFSDAILRLGGIHMLMSFGALIADSGLSEISESTFGVVSTMLSGEKPHKNVYPSFTGGIINVSVVCQEVGV